MFIDAYDDVLKLFHSPHQSKHRRSSVHKPACLDKSVETDMAVEHMPSLTHWDLLEDNSPGTLTEMSNSLSKNLESKCAYLQMENLKLQKTIEAYTTQMLQIEQDHEELLVVLASYDNELKQLRESLQAAEDTAAHMKVPSASINGSVNVAPTSLVAQTGLITEEALPASPKTPEPTSAKLRFGSILTEPSPSSHTFDV